MSRPATSFSCPARPGALPHDMNGDIVIDGALHACCLHCGEHDPTPLLDRFVGLTPDLGDVVRQASESMRRMAEAVARTPKPRRDPTRLVIDGRLLRVGDELLVMVQDGSARERCRVTRLSTQALSVEFLSGPVRGGVQLLTDEDVAGLHPDWARRV